MKKTMILAGLAATITAAAPASAAIYNYDAYISNGIGNANIAIDSSAGTATYSGRNIDLTVSSNKLKGFTGATKKTTYLASDISGTFSRYGRTYNAFHSTRPKYTQISLGNNFNFLWTYGRDRWGRIYDFDGKGNLKYTGSTGGSSGGTPVPAPGILGLFGLGLAGLAFGRRRTMVKAKAKMGLPAAA